MNWKTDLRLSDLGDGQQIEVSCKVCGLTRYEVPSDLMKESAYRQLALDELEERLSCHGRHCRGSVRLAIIHDDKTEGFVGGMA